MFGGRKFTKGSGRLELAQSITSKENPLTARVMVNRVRMLHFGKPLVSLPSDFGMQTPRNPSRRNCSMTSPPPSWRKAGA